MIKTLLLSSLVLNLGLLLGRMSGFAREALVASSYGSTAEADIVVLMLTVPDLLVNILMGGAMSVALIPAFTRSPERAKKLLFQVMLIIAVIFSLITLIFVSAMPEFVSVIAPGFTKEKIEQASQLLRWVIWLLPLTVLAGATTAYLQSQNKFAIPALGTLIINSIIILGVLYTQKDQALLVLALFILAGGILRLISQLLQVKWQWQPRKLLSPVLVHRTLLKHYFQAMMAGSILLLLPVIARAMASFSGDGSLALFNYAMKLIEFPLTIAVTFIGIILFPRIAKSFGDNIKLHHQLVKTGVQITLILAIISTVSLQLLSWEYVQVVFGYGAMDLDGQKMIVDLITIGLIVLPLQGLAIFLTLTFNARNETRIPMIINIVGLVIFLVLINIESFGQDLFSLMWALLATYAIICCMQLMSLKIDNFKWFDVFFERWFVMGLLLIIPTLYFINLALANLALSSWLAIGLSALTGFVALFLFALLNMPLRKALVISMRGK